MVRWDQLSRGDPMRSNRLLPATLMCAVALFALAGWGGAAPQPPESAPQPPSRGFAGSDMCMACHTEVGDHLAKTPHGSKAFARLSAQGCESCHGPAAAHAENPDDPAL